MFFTILNICYFFFIKLFFIILIFLKYIYIKSYIFKL